MNAASPPPNPPTATPCRLRIAVTVEAEGTSVSPRSINRRAILRPSARSDNTAPSIVAELCLGRMKRRPLDQGPRPPSQKPLVAGHRRDPEPPAGPWKVRSLRRGKHHELQSLHPSGNLAKRHPTASSQLAAESVHDVSEHPYLSSLNSGEGGLAPQSRAMSGGGLTTILVWAGCFTEAPGRKGSGRPTRPAAFGIRPPSPQGGGKSRRCS